MLTVKQVRDIYMSLWNNSTAITRLADHDTNIQKLHDKCSMLTYDDKELQKNIDAGDDRLNKLITEAQTFS